MVLPLTQFLRISDTLTLPVTQNRTWLHSQKYRIAQSQLHALETIRQVPNR
jgi:hypothetical protein